MSLNLATEWLRRFNATMVAKGAPVGPTPPSSAFPGSDTGPSANNPVPVTKDKTVDETPDSDDKGIEPDIDDQQWFMGGLDYTRDPQTGLAKWPLSFKVMVKDVKLPNGKDAKVGAHPRDQKPEQPPTAV